MIQRAGHRDRYIAVGCTATDQSSEIRRCRIRRIFVALQFVRRRTFSSTVKSSCHGSCELRLCIAVHDASHAVGRSAASAPRAFAEDIHHALESKPEPHNRDNLSRPSSSVNAWRQARYAAQPAANLILQQFLRRRSQAPFGDVLPSAQHLPEPGAAELLHLQAAERPVCMQSSCCAVAVSRIAHW